MATSDTSEARDIAVLLLNTAKSKTCSLPVKKRICWHMAELISKKQNYAVRQ